MFVRIFPQKDTFITNFQRNSVPQTGSNFGASEILHLYVKAGVSGAVGVTASASLARVLSQFDLTTFQQLTGSGLMPQSGVVYRLHMSDAQHKGTTPSSYDVEVQAVSQSWDEGKGRDTDSYSDRGFANWDKRTSTQFWSVTGSSGVGVISSQHFDDGREDIDVDVTDIVNSWMTGGLENNGFLVAMSSTLEVGTQDFFRKMLHARNTHFPDRRPYLEARWDDSILDDRNNFFWDVSGTLYLYNVVRGQPTDIVGIGTGSIGVKLSDLSGTIGFVTGSHTGVTGIYSASFAIATGSYSGSLWSDVWFNLSAPDTWYMTGSFGIADSFARQDLHTTRYFVTVTNLQDTYDGSEDVRMDLYIRPHDYNPAQVLTASLDSLGMVMTKAYYRIVNDRTDQVVVPFSTGALEYTRLSYDQRGNHFRLMMSNLPAGEVYRLTFLFNVDGRRQVIDQDLKFKVV